MHDVVIGIDPDVRLNGIGIVYPKSRRVEVFKASFCDTLRLVERFKAMMQEHGMSVMIFVEGCWLNESNWHLSNGMSRRMAAAVGRNVGVNHQSGILLHECIKDYLGMPCEVQRPLFKHWAGTNGKITQDEMTAIVGYKLPRMNQDQRDALLLAWGKAESPIRVKTNVKKK